MRALSRFLRAILTMMWVFGALHARAQSSPELTGIGPYSARPGETIEIRLPGINLQKPLALWTSFGATTEWHAHDDKDGSHAKDESKELRGKMTLPKNAPLGIGFVQLSTEAGLSGPIFFFVDELAVVKKARSMESIEKAQTIALPVAIEGTTDSSRADYYRFEVKAGASISIDVFAARMASALDPAIRLLDVKGKELAAIDDTPGLAGDCRLRYRAEQDGPIILELRDASYNGGGLFRYHVRIGDIPFVSGEIPPASDPNAKVSAPCTLFGRIEKRGGRCVFNLPMKKGEGVTLTPVTRELGSPAILYVAIEDEKGNIVASNDGAGNQAGTETATSFKTPRDGAFRIVCEDAAQRGGPEYGFGLRVERSDRGFALSIAGERFVVGRGGSFSAKVTAKRHSGNEAIRLELVNGEDGPLPPGFSIEQNMIEKGKNDTLLKIKAPVDFVPGALFHVRVIGHMKDGSEEFTAAAALPQSNPDAKKDKSDHVTKMLHAMPQVPRLLRETVAICVGPEAPDFFSLQLTTGEVDLPTILGKNTFVIRQMALDSSFTQSVELKFEGLPPGISIQHSGGRGGRIKDQTDFVCEITGGSEMLLGLHSFKVIGVGTHKGVTKEVRLGNVPLRIVKPLGISAELEGTLEPNGKAKVKVTATRFGDLADAQPIDVELKHLPVGITTAGKTTIPAGKSEIEIDVDADEKTAPGVFDNIQVLATTTVKGSAVSVEGAHLRIEVKK